MGNLEDKNKYKYNTNSAGESHQFHPDPIRQARDDSSRSHKTLQPIEIVHSANKPMSVTDATLLSNQFVGMGESTQTVQSGDDIIRLMFRFKWMALAISILIAAPMIAAIWTQVVPEYRAGAQVRVQPILPFLVFRTEDSGKIPLYDAFVNTQASIVKSTTILRRVLDMQEVQETKWYKEPPKSLLQRLQGDPPTPHIERLKGALSVRPRVGTELIDVTFVDSSVKDAVIIVNAILDQFIIYNGEMSEENKDELYSKLIEQYKTLEKEIQGQELVSANLSKTLGTGTPEELVSSKKVRLDETQARLSELQQNIALLEWEQKKLEDFLKQAITDDSNDVMVTPSEGMEKQAKYYEDAEWRALDVNVRTFRHKIATSLLTSKHPILARMEKDLKFAEELLRLHEMRLEEQWRGRPKNPAAEERLKSLEHQLARSKYEEQLLLLGLKDQQDEYKIVFEKAQLLDKEKNELRHKRELFSTVRRRLDQKKMERNVPGSIEVMTRAFASSKPYNDRRVVLTATALFLGLSVGGGLAFLRASSNQAIYTPKDMPHPMQIPLLGYIPVTHTRRSSDEEISPGMIESIRFVRTALLARLNYQGKTTILVTSADEGTGKSTFTMMLGKSFAQAGKKVLMIDTDFRKMTLTKRLNLSGKSGFLESLYCKSVDKGHIFPTETLGLSIIPAGKRSNEGMLFEGTANGAFKACIGQLRKPYDIILLDSSPILPVADATILSGQVDGTIMVERELVSRRENVINALALLGSAGGRLLGTVFVGSSSHEGYTYNYHYGKSNES